MMEKKKEWKEVGKGSYRSTVRRPWDRGLFHRDCHNPHFWIRPYPPFLGLRVPYGDGHIRVTLPDPSRTCKAFPRVPYSL